MAKSKIPNHPNLQKYGIPFYAAAWAPYKEISSKLISKADDNDDRPSGESSSVGDGISSQNSAQHFVVLAGGGGEGHNGIPNAVVLSLFDFASNSLSPPVAKLGFGSDLPYRMVVHPGGDGVICAFPNSCKFYKWEEVKECGTNELGLNLRQLQNKGQQLALTFNSQGSVLAVGGEDGNLRVFKWPSMEIILDEAEAHTSLKDLCFSPDGKFLVSLGSRGPGRVWDMSSTTVVASLSKENDEVFASCRFSQNSEKNQVLFIAAITGKGGSILTWNTSSWKRMSSKHVVKEPASSFDVSPDGKHLAIGTIQGDVLLVNSTDMRVQMMVRKAHLGIVTALRFSHDSRALVSASMDSSARVTLVKDKKSGGLSWLIIIFIIIIAIAAYILKNEGLIPPVA